MQEKFNTSKEYPKGRWLICKPTYYTVSYEINPWMDVKVVPNLENANMQWDNLLKAFQKIGAKVELLDPVKNCPDLVFTANGGLIKDNKVVLANFEHKERQSEEKYFKEWFVDNGFEVVETDSIPFEGEGDAEFAGDILFAAHGFRSSKEIYDVICQKLEIEKIVHCELIDPYFYHIDTCFRPISKEVALVYPPAFSDDSLVRMRKNIELIEVSESDAKKFVCNAVVIGRDVILPAACDSTCEILESRGYRPHPVELTEFLKAGGSAKCLCLRIDR